MSATTKMLSEQQSSAPYIEPNEYDSHYLSDAYESRLRKGVTQSTDQSLTKELTSIKITNQEAKDSIVEKNIRNVFSTNFGPGLHLFNVSFMYTLQTEGIRN